MKSLSRCMVALFCAALLLQFAQTSPANQSAPGGLVFIINSYSIDFPWTRDHNAALRQGLGDRASFLRFDMDTKRIPEAHFVKRAQEAFEACRKAAPDLVVLTDDNALRLLGQRLLDDGAKVLFLGINNNPRAYLNDPRGATGVLERPLFRRSVQTAGRVLGQAAGRGLILFDASPTSRVLHDDIFSGGDSYRVGDIATDFLTTNSLEQWRSAILDSAQNGYGFIALGLRHTLTDAQGVHADPDEVTAWAARHSPLPLFGFWDFDVGPDKTLGGMVLTGSNHGAIAAVLAARILDGEPVQAIPPIHDRQGLLLFSASGLKRRGLALPRGIRDEAVITD